MHRVYRPFIVAALISIAGCATLMPFGNTLAKATSNTELRRAMLDVVPIGTSVGQAEMRMRLRGFSCKVERNTSFSERNWTGDVKKSSDGIDILHCERTEKAGNPMIKTWDVAFVLEGDIVKDVLACHYLDAR